MPAEHGRCIVGIVAACAVGRIVGFMRGKIDQPTMLHRFVLHRSVLRALRLAVFGVALSMSSSIPAVAQKAAFQSPRPFQVVSADPPEISDSKEDFKQTTENSKKPESPEKSSKVPASEPPANALSVFADGLSLENLEAMALASNPSIARATAAVAAARGAVVQSGMPFNPVVGYQGQQIGSGGRAEQHGLGVSQEFLRNEKRGLNREVACRELQMAEHRLNAQRVRVQTDVRMAFFRTMRAQRQIDISGELLRISEQVLRTAQTLLEAKEIPRTDVLQAQIEVDVAKAALDSARNQHASSWSGLSAVLGQPALTVQPLAGNLYATPAELEFESLLAWLRGQSPEMAEAWANIERARLFLQRQIVEPKPNLSIQALYNFVDNGNLGKPDAGIALSVPVPVHNLNQGAIQQARFQVVVAEQAMAQLELALQQRLAPVFERYSTAKNQLAQYSQRILPAAAEALKLTTTAFEIGEIGFTNLLVVQRSYRQHQVALLDAAESLRIAEAEINGLLLSGSLTP